MTVIDTETTGSDPATAKVCEVGAVDLRLHRGRWRLDTMRSLLVNPGIPIPADAMGTHHITDKMVERAPGLDTALDRLCLTPANVRQAAAHNAAYDSALLPSLPGPWLCTYRIALHLWPDAPNHRNQTLRYHLGVHPELPEGQHAHRALYDAVVTAEILRVALQDHDVDELLALQTQPALLRRVPGRPNHTWETIDLGYARWMLTKDFGPDAERTARHWIAARTGRGGML